MHNLGNNSILLLRKLHVANALLYLILFVIAVVVAVVIAVAVAIAGYVAVAVAIVLRCKILIDMPIYN